MKLLLLAMFVTATMVIMAMLLSSGLIPNVNSDEDVMAFWKSGDKLKAIKAYRQLHGASLKQAKHFIKNQLKDKRDINDE